MAKAFYTERDIEDLYARGVTSLTVSDEIVVTDLGREKAMKLGFALVREADKDTPPSAPVRPYITKQASPSGSVAKASKPAKPASTKADMEQRVLQAVKAKVGDQADPKLLETIVKRVLQSVGRS